MLTISEVCYNQEDDDHLPSLTVGQTIRFALQLRSPKKKIPGVTPSQFREEVVKMLLSMLNIKHTENTIVGNAFMRGVSGGERKRVSIAEMFCGGACVASWDNSTRGLDASTALDYAKSLRLLTDIMQMTTFVSLYQAGEGIYDQFDKVMVLDESRVVYFGPAKQARKYMLGLGYKVGILDERADDRTFPVKHPQTTCPVAPTPTSGSSPRAETKTPSRPPLKPCTRHISNRTFAPRRYA